MCKIPRKVSTNSRPSANVNFCFPSLTYKMDPLLVPKPIPGSRDTIYIEKKLTVAKETYSRALFYFINFTWVVKNELLCNHHLYCHDQHCPLTLSAMMEMSHISTGVTTRHMWQLSAWSIASEPKDPIFKVHFNLNLISYQWLMSAILDNVSSPSSRKFEDASRSPWWCGQSLPFLPFPVYLEFICESSPIPLIPIFAHY